MGFRDAASGQRLAIFRSRSAKTCAEFFDRDDRAYGNQPKRSVPAAHPGTGVPSRSASADRPVLAHKLAELERKVERHDTGTRTLFDAIHRLTTPPVKPRREIGFQVKEHSMRYRVRRK